MSKLAAEKHFISMRSTVTQSRQQVSCDLGDEVVVLSLKNGAYYGLDPVAARIWGLLAEPRTVGSVRDALIAEYTGVDPDRCAREIAGFIRQLAKWELVEVAPT